MINIVIPMAGAGSRFAKAGYKKPKPFIDVLGKPMICHVLDNLNMPNAKFILLARAEHYNNEQETVNWIKDHYNVEFVLIDKLTEGAACTVLHAHRLINNNTPLLIANSDQIVDMDIADYINDSDNRNLDGSVLCFEDDDKKWSYAKLDKNGLITEIREKEVISEHATVGIYYFKKGSDFVENAIDMFVRNERVNNEFYVAPVYNYSIACGGKFGIYSIDKTQMHGTGTPEDLDKYIELKKENRFMEKIYVFEASNKHGIYGYTRQEDGSNLPVKFENKPITWEFSKDLEIEENEPPRIGLNTTEMLEHINNNGFYINKITINIQISQ